MKVHLPKEFILIPLIFLLVACASTFFNLKKVERGMTSGEVEAIMGSYHGAKTIEKEGFVYTLYRYEDHLCNPNLSFWDRCDFLVVFKNGKVIETGVKQGGSYSPNLAHLSLFQQP